MPALTAADVTITITKQWIAGPSKFVIGTLAIAGTNTYPTAGIPLPAVGNFAFKRNIDSLMITGVNGLTTDYLARYNKSAHKLMLFEEEAVAAGGPLLEADTAEVPGARTYDFLAIGW